MEEKKYLGMPYYICIALSILLFPFGIVTLAVEKENVEKEHKQAIIAGFVFAAVDILLSIIQSIFSAAGLEVGFWIILVAEILFTIIWVIAFVQAFRNIIWHCPGVWQIAGLFVKEEEKPQGEDSEVVSEQKQEETKEENE